MIFKASFDKANRSSIKSFRGPGLEEGLQILSGIRDEFKLPITSDIHEPFQVEAAAKVLDLVQVPAFLCRQTDLIVACAQHASAINIKKGQFLAPEAMRQVVTKVRENNPSVPLLLTDRGTCFGYGDLVVDMRSIPKMQSLGTPVIFDATHSVQKPGGLGDRTGGEREYACLLASSAIAAGADAIFMEVHEDPDKALSDGPNMLPLQGLDRVFRQLRAFRDTFVSCRVDETPRSSSAS